MQEYIHYLLVYGDWLQVWAFYDEAQEWIGFTVPCYQFKRSLVFGIENQLDFVCCHPVGQLFAIVISGRDSIEN